MKSSAESEVIHGSVSTDYDADDQAQPMPFTQGELNYLTRDFNLSKKSAQLLSSCLPEKLLLAPTTTFYWYRQREANLPNSSRMMKDLHWSTVTMLLTSLKHWV